jgi:membrane protein implicated in regulation of membrane protease activity
MSAFHRIGALALLLFALPAAAYIGPGSGISLLGGIWSVLVAIVLALAAILFWPIRLMVKRMRARKNGQPPEERPAAPGDGE